MTGGDEQVTSTDGLARARRALRGVSGELDLTWGDVLTRAESGPEVVPVVPLADPRRPRPSTVRRVAVAATLLVALGSGAAALAQAGWHRGTSIPPADPVSMAAPSPSATVAPTTRDAAQVVVDRARDAFRATAWCSIRLESSDPRTVLWLGDDLDPVGLADERGQRGRTQDGALVAVDTAAGTWWPLTTSWDMVADRPSLGAAVAALQMLVAKDSAWRPADDAAPDVVTVVVGGGVTVAAAVDPRTGLPTRLVPDTAPGGFTVVWLSSCDGAKPAPIVTVPSGYASAPASR